MNLKSNKSGFTLIELVMVIVILGILAVVAIPQFFDLSTRAQTSAHDGIVGGVRGGIHNYYANVTPIPDWPTVLDANADGACVTCFSAILAQGLSDAGWSKAGSDYTNNNLTTPVTVTYNSGTGTFQP